MLLGSVGLEPACLGALWIHVVANRPRPGLLPPGIPNVKAPPTLLLMTRDAKSPGAFVIRMKLFSPVGSSDIHGMIATRDAGQRCY